MCAAQVLRVLGVAEGDDSLRFYVDFTQHEGKQHVVAGLRCQGLLCATMRRLGECVVGFLIC